MSGPSSTRCYIAGQVEGGMIQGFGFAMSEDLAAEDGKIVTANLGEYKLPNIRDIPAHETLYVRDHTGPGPFQAKQIGEHGAIPTAAAIANAVYDAIGVQITDLPITAERSSPLCANGPLHSCLKRHPQNRFPVRQPRT
mgnify:CR=1 FL=1